MDKKRWKISPIAFVHIDTHRERERDKKNWLKKTAPHPPNLCSPKAKKGKKNKKEKHIQNLLFMYALGL